MTSNSPTYFVWIDGYNSEFARRINKAYDGNTVGIETSSYKLKKLVPRLSESNPELFKKIIYHQNLETTLDQLRNYNVVFVANGTDLSLNLSQQLNHALGIRTGFAKNENVPENKFQMLRKLFLQNLTSNEPRLVNAENEFALISKPANYIVKPIHGTGSMGVYLNAAPSKFPAIVQEFFEGDEFSFDFVSKEGIHEIVYGWKYERQSRFEIPKQLIQLVQPHEFKKEHLDMIERCRKALDAFDFRNGPSHIEVKYNALLEKIEIVEINFRIQGHTPYKTLLQMRGTDQIDQFLAMLSNRTVTKNPEKDFKLVRFILQSPKSQQIELNWLKLKSLKTIKELHTHYPSGRYHMEKARNITEYLGYITLAHVDSEAVNEEIRALYQWQESLGV